MAPTAARTNMDVSSARLRIETRLEPGEKLTIGPLEITSVAGVTTITYRKRARLVLLARRDRTRVICLTDGAMLPGTDDACQRESQDAGRTEAPGGRQGHGRPADPPILRLGPGGDYVRDFYGEDLTGNEEPEDDARAGT